MIILGITFLTDASACIIRDGELVAAVSEERLNRQKLWNGFPNEAIEEVLRIAGITLDDVDYVATHGVVEPGPDEAAFESKRNAIKNAPLDSSHRDELCAAINRRHVHEEKVFNERTPNRIESARGLGRPLKVYGHHHGHAASAFYGSGWDECLVLTADGWGEDASATLYQGRKTDTASDCLVRLARTPTIDSLGYFYGSITKALGFTPHRHEGKILGLAAYCQDPKSYKSIREMIGVDHETHQFVGRSEKGIYLPEYNNPYLDSLVKDYDRVDVSAAAQISLEEVVCELVSSMGPQARRLALAGGIFANVKLNERLSELDNVEEIYVFPNMGDGGLSVGTAWLAYHELSGKYPAPPQSMYLGQDIIDEEVEEAASAAGLKFSKSENIHEDIGQLLFEGQVVARCTDRMEFGPRALGHRSILYQASEPDVNDWLNKKLGRSEFMPFAPATLEETASEYYSGLEAGGISSEFMTITFPCTPKMCQEAPAAVHVDNTARPQIIRKERSPDFHAILSAYREKSGLSSVINTSFNMHEEPIVCSAQDAVRAFISSQLPYLAIGPYLVEGPSR